VNREDADIREVAQPLEVYPRHQAGHTAAFWFLMVIAFAVFTPCVLMPAWIRYGELYRQEQIMAARVAAMTEAQDKLDRTIEALRTDPGVNERVAIRELGYKRHGEMAAASLWDGNKWQLLQSLEPIEVNVAPNDLQLPVAMSRLLSYLPNWPYVEVFCESPYRETSLAMSIALMGFAFILYQRRESDFLVEEG